MPGAERDAMKELSEWLGGHLYRQCNLSFEFEGKIAVRLIDENGSHIHAKDSIDNAILSAIDKVKESKP